jgi:hypothetical protein
MLYHPHQYTVFGNCVLYWRANTTNTLPIHDVLEWCWPSNTQKLFSMYCIGPGNAYQKKNWYCIVNPIQYQYTVLALQTNTIHAVTCNMYCNGYTIGVSLWDWVTAHPCKSWTWILIASINKYYLYVFKSSLSGDGEFWIFNMVEHCFWIYPWPIQLCWECIIPWGAWALMLYWCGWSLQ